MPKVGGKQFGYGKEGKEKAKKYARAHGLKVKRKSNPGYYAESVYERLGKLLNEDWKMGVAKHYLRHKGAYDTAAKWADRASTAASVAGGLVASAPTGGTAAVGTTAATVGAKQYVKKKITGLGARMFGPSVRAVQQLGTKKGVSKTAGQIGARLQRGKLVKKGLQAGAKGIADYVRGKFSGLKKGSTGTTGDATRQGGKIPGSEDVLSTGGASEDPEKLGGGGRGRR